MRRIERLSKPRPPVAVVAPSQARARVAAELLRYRWGGAPLVALSLAAFLVRSGPSRILLCPSGRGIDEDLAFLRQANRRLLWPAADGALRAAIAGLLGEHPPPLSTQGPASGSAEGNAALLLEGIVTPQRARRALRSPARAWIVQSPLFARLSPRQLRELARQGIRWTVLEPVSLDALLASPELARARDRWSRVLPVRTRVEVLRPSSARPKQ